MHIVGDCFLSKTIELHSCDKDYKACLQSQELSLSGPYSRRLSPLSGVQHAVEVLIFILFFHGLRLELHSPVKSGKHVASGPRKMCYESSKPQRTSLALPASNSLVGETKENLTFHSPL